MGKTARDRIRQIADGDPAASAWLYDTFAPLLYRRLLRRYAYLEGADVEDVLHDTFVLALRSDAEWLRRSLLEEEDVSLEQLAQMLWNLACGLVANRRRSAARRKTLSLPDDADPPAAAIFEGPLLDRDRLARLDVCLREGGPKVYLYFKLRFEDGLTPEEISQATGWSRKAVYKLRQTLNEVVAQCAKKLGL